MRGYYSMIYTLLGDLTKVKGFEAIVNAANETLLGGVDGAIHRAAGIKLLEECRTLNGCKTGEAKHTKGYDLSCRYIIHTVGPVWKSVGNEDKYLAECYYNVMKLAFDLGIKKIAFPSISTGRYCFPVERAAKIAIISVGKFLEQYPNHFEKVCWVLFDKETKRSYDQIIEVYNKKIEKHQ